MPKFRKKPVVIEAHQWLKNGDHPDDYSLIEVGIKDGQPVEMSGEYRKSQNWEGIIVRYFRHPDLDGPSICQHCGKSWHDHGWVDTLEAGHRVCPGDWIITGIKGEYYPCKPDVFALTYERVD